MTVNRAMNEERLKPCPCCESTDVGTEFVGKMEYVICRSCGLQTLAFFEKGQAIKRWNTRKPMERIVERLENMKLIRVEQCHEDYELELITEGHFDDAIEIVKGGGVDE